MLTKKYFIAIAKIIKDSKYNGNTQECKIGNAANYVLASNLADYFQKENINFDREKFIKACGF